MGYALIDNDERRVLAAFNYLENALTLLEQLRQRSPGRDLAVVWLDERPGEIVGTTSSMAVRVGGPVVSGRLTALCGGHRRIAAQSQGTSRTERIGG
jgi:hypothetical protein